MKRCRLAILSVLLICAWAGGKTGDLPNLVFFISDDLSRLDTSVYGSADVKTPNLDRLAARGMTFENAFIASPACAPSRGALLTGLMPARNGAEANHTYPRPGTGRLVSGLKRQGYDVIAIGKVAHGSKSIKEEQFDVFNGRARDIAAQVKAHFKTRRSTKPVCLLVGDRRPHVAWIKESTYDPKTISLPCTLLDTPETRQHRARYYTDITGLDREIGEVFNFVYKKLGDNTLFMFSSDHGSQWPFGKWNLYDEGIRVPMIVVWPGPISPGSRTTAMVSWVDIFPTLLDLVHVKQPAGLDGRPFTDVLMGKTHEHRSLIFTTQSGDGRMNVYPIRSVRDQRYKYIMNLLPHCYHTNHSDILRKDGAGAYWDSWDVLARTDERAKALVDRYYVRPAEEFYDLQSDPFEQNNLADQPASQERKRAMKETLLAWMVKQGDKKTVFNTPYPVTKPKPRKKDF